MHWGLGFDPRHPTTTSGDAFRRVISRQRWNFQLSCFCLSDCGGPVPLPLSQCIHDSSVAAADFLTPSSSCHCLLFYDIACISVLWDRSHHTQWPAREPARLLLMTVGICDANLALAKTVVLAPLLVVVHTTGNPSLFQCLSFSSVSGCQCGGAFAAFAVGLWRKSCVSGCAALTLLALFFF